LATALRALTSENIKRKIGHGQPGLPRPLSVRCRRNRLSCLQSAGAYRLARLAAKFGPEIALRDLTDRFSYDCMWRAEARSKKGKSARGVSLPDLEQPRPLRARKPRPRAQSQSTQPPGVRHPRLVRSGRIAIASLKDWRGSACGILSRYVTTAAGNPRAPADAATRYFVFAHASRLFTGLGRRQRAPRGQGGKCQERGGSYSIASLGSVGLSLRVVSVRRAAVGE
jgi:hypothetical protein